MMIYGITQTGDDSVIKIGFSGTSVLKRCESLQTSNWRDLVIVAVMPGKHADETRLHEEFAHYHVRGEWFLNHGEVAAWVEAWKAGPRTRYEYTKSEIDNRKQAKMAAARVAHERFQSELADAARAEANAKVTALYAESRARALRERRVMSRCSWPAVCECGKCKRARRAATEPLLWRGIMRVP